MKTVRIRKDGSFRLAGALPVRRRLHGQCGAEHLVAKVRSRSRARSTPTAPWHASYYGPGLYGNRTACGKTLNRRTGRSRQQVNPALRNEGHPAVPRADRKARVIDRGPVLGQPGVRPDQRPARPSSGSVPPGRSSPPGRSGRDPELQRPGRVPHRGAARAGGCPRLRPDRPPRPRAAAPGAWGRTAGRAPRDRRPPCRQVRGGEGSVFERVWVRKGPGESSGSLSDPNTHARGETSADRVG